MTRDLVSVSRKSSIQEAIQLMKKFSIRHLPVLEEDGEFVGFVTESDLRGVLIPSMVETITVEDVMIAEPITITSTDSVEKAAILLYRHKIGGLPVVDDNRLVGIITVADVLESFIEFVGVLEASSRLDVVLKREPGAFEEVTRFIREYGGRVISVGVTLSSQHGEVHSFRLKRADLNPLISRLNEEGHQVIGWED